MFCEYSPALIPVFSFFPFPLFSFSLFLLNYPFITNEPFITCIIYVSSMLYRWQCHTPTKNIFYVSISMLYVYVRMSWTICTTRKHSRRIIDTSLHVLNYLHSVSVQRITNRHRTVKRSCFNGQCSRTFLACKIAEWACTNSTRMY